MRIRCFTALVLLSFTFGLPAAAPPNASIAVLLRQLDADDFFVRQKADTALRAMGKSVLPTLRREMVRTSSLEVRWRLGRMVNDLTIDERIEGLVELLNDSDAQMRERADYALRRAGPAVVPLLQKELKPTLAEEHRRRLEKIIAELAGPR